MNRYCALVLALVVAAANPGAARAADAEAVGKCHRAIASGLFAVSRGRIAIVGRCLKGLRYDSCEENDMHGVAHEMELRNFVAGERSPCRAAIESGAGLEDFGPLSCADAWDDCDTEIPVIRSLEDLAECLICQERGFDFKIRAELGMPRPAPADIDERLCTRAITKLASSTVRRSIFDTRRCADEGNEKPFACPIDPTTESRFGASLAKIPATVARCRIDDGKAPGALVNLCGGDATDAASLANCFEGLAKCLACHTANSQLGQSEDCAASSGFARCEGMF